MTRSLTLGHGLVHRAQIILACAERESQVGIRCGRRPHQCLTPYVKMLSVNFQVMSANGRFQGNRGGSIRHLLRMNSNFMIHGSQV